MSTKYEDAHRRHQKAEADARRAKEVGAEMARMRGILQSTEASRHFDEAVTLATETEMPAKEARSYLAELARASMPTELPGLAHCTAGNDLGPDLPTAGNPEASAAAGIIAQIERASGRTT